MTGNPEFFVIGAGSTGRAVAAGLTKKQTGSVTAIEVRKSDRSQMVKMPLWLAWMIGHRARLMISEDVA